MTLAGQKGGGGGAKEEEKEEEEAGQEVEDWRREPFRGDTHSLTHSVIVARSTSGGAPRRYT